MDPSTTALLIKAGSDVLSAGASKPNAPQYVMSGAPTTTNSWFDGSGWTVATGKASAKGGDRQDTAGTLPALAGSPMLYVAAALVGLLIWTKAKK